MADVKKGGRPPKSKEGNRNRTLGFRVRGGIDEKLAAAAQENGRSVSEEIEYRLIRSFEPRPEAVAAELLFGSRSNVFYLTLVASVLDSISTIEQQASNDPEGEWGDSIIGQAAAAAAIKHIADKLIAPSEELTEREVSTVQRLKDHALEAAFGQVIQDRRRERAAARRAAGLPDYSAMFTGVEPEKSDG